MKQMLLTTVVTGMITIFGPHDLPELGNVIARAGVLIMRLGLLLEPRGYDPGWSEPAPPDQKPSTERA